MKQKEKEVIKYLREGKRVNISEIARELKLPVSTVRDRIKRIEDRYVIKRSSLLDFRKTGYSANVILAVKTDSKKEEFLDFLMKQKCINSIYRINSGYSFLLEIVCRDSLQLITWIEKIKARFALEITPFQILKVEKKEIFLP